MRTFFVLLCLFFLASAVLASPIESLGSDARMIDASMDSNGIEHKQEEELPTNRHGW